MNGIDGNKTAQIQVCIASKNAIGEDVKAWETVQSINGWLDLSTGDSKHTVYNAKVQESTHIFLADYRVLDSRVSAENSRMIIDGKRYDITLIDDPMELHQQLEIYLKFTGGQ